MIAQSETSLTAQTTHFSLFAALGKGSSNEIHLPIVIKEN